MLSAAVAAWVAAMMTLGVALADEETTPAPLPLPLPRVVPAPKEVAPPSSAAPPSPVDPPSPAAKFVDPPSPAAKFVDPPSPAADEPRLFSSPTDRLEAVVEPPPVHHPRMGGGWAAPPQPPIDKAIASSWLYQPLSVDVFAGLLVGNVIQNDWVGQRQGVIGGLRFGKECDEHWGWEARFAMGSTLLFDSEAAIEARLDRDDARGLGVHDPGRYRFADDRYADRTLLDAMLLHYPFGDTRLRPYVGFGLGFAQVRYADLLGVGHSVGDMTLPLSVGLKYLWTDRLAVRLDCNDTIVLGGSGQMNTLHDLSLTGAMEVRFGRARKLYWPWNPGNRTW